MPKKRKKITPEPAQRVIVIPQPKLFLGQWTMDLIAVLPDIDRYRKLIALDEQLPDTIRAKWSARDVAEFLGWTPNTVNSMFRAGYLDADGTRNERGDKFWYPSSILRYLVARMEREQAKEQTD